MMPIAHKSLILSSFFYILCSPHVHERAPNRLHEQPPQEKDLLGIHIFLHLRLKDCATLGRYTHPASPTILTVM